MSGGFTIPFFYRSSLLGAMTFTIRQVLLTTAFSSVVLTLIAVSIKLESRTSELTSLQASVTKPTLHHPSAAIRLYRLDEVSRPSVLPLVLAPGRKQVSANMASRSGPPAVDAVFSVIARYIGSVQDGDVYEIIWVEGMRLPPESSTHDLPASSKFVKTGSGVVTVYESDRWKLEIVDNPAQSPFP